jgi:hypothetical protein
LWPKVEVACAVYYVKKHEGCNIQLEIHLIYDFYTVTTRGKRTTIAVEPVQRNFRIITTPLATLMNSINLSGMSIMVKSP